jgi:uncharacterized damage-inducible protein DinB
MELKSIIEQLDHQGKAMIALAQGLTNTQADWGPGEEEWSVRQVFEHLVREEIRDFRRYLLGAFADTGSAMTLTEDFEAEDGQYDLSELVALFAAEREQSLAWLAALDDPDSEREIEMPWGGTLHAGDILISWPAHDLLHLRQLVALRFGITEAAGDPYSVQYAGEW